MIKNRTPLGAPGKILPGPAARSFLAVAVFVAACVIGACIPDTGQWYPKAKTGLVSCVETTDGGRTTCTVTFRIVNTGASIIRATTISASVATDARTYYATAVDATAILPGGSVFIGMRFMYVVAAEKVIPDGVAIVSEFYE